MKQRRDLTGQRFGRLVALSFFVKDKRAGYWLCQCDCGNQKEVLAYNLGKNANSCGCYRKEQMSSVGSKNTWSKKHGLAYKPIYQTWRSMRDRCNSPKVSNYANYGGRGISYDRRWEKFENFIEDMGIPEPGMSLDRIDCNANYSKENCRWATRLEQNNNTRRNITITFEGKTQTVAEWAREKNIPYNRLKYRVDHGWKTEMLFAEGTFSCQNPSGQNHSVSMPSS